MTVKQKHSLKHLFWRGVVAAGSNAAMVAGVYPVIPQVGLAIARRRAGKRQPPHQLRTTMREWVVSVAVAAARPVGFVGLGGTKAVGPRPIVVLHGYVMNRANYVPMVRRLSRAGLGPIYGFEYWTLGKIPSAARRLSEFVEQVRAEHGADSVDLIGHSLGGIVGRYYAQILDANQRVRHLITIGSPHGGTAVAWAGFGRMRVELKPGSALLRQLYDAAIPDHLHMTAIWSRADPLVPGPRSARVSGTDELVYDDLGHLSMLTSRRVAQDIIERLRSA